jgi:WD40 repeat protein
MPVMHLDEDQLLVTAASSILVHDFLPPRQTYGGKSVSGLTECHTVARPSALDDITGIVRLPDGQLVISTVRGKLQRLRLPQVARYRQAPRLECAVASTAHYVHPPNNAIETLSSSGNMVLSAAHDGFVSLFNAKSPWTPPSTTNIGARAWSSLLNLDTGSPYAAIGSSGKDPLQLLLVTPSGIVSDGSKPFVTLTGPTKRSAVYSITTPPRDMSTPYSNSPSNLLLSAWFDGYARLYDLRCDNARKGAVLQMTDPWSDSSLYSCTFAGLGFVAAGAARHALVHVWDPRMLASSAAERSLGNNVTRPGGWSAFAPGRPESPVYDIKGEGSRIWAVTSTSTFVMAFDVADREDRTSAHGWDIVLPALRPSAVMGDRMRARGFDTVQRNQFKDYATGYCHEDRSVRLFDSLGSGRKVRS